MLHSPAYRSVAAAPATMALSSGAIAGIAIAGSVALMLLIGPVLIQIAKWQERQHEPALCPVSSVSFSEDGQQVSLPPKRLRKKVPVSQGADDSDEVRDDASGGGGGGERGMRLGKRLSFPVLPPVFSRPGSFILGNPFSFSLNEGPGDGSGDGTSPQESVPQSRTDAYEQEERRHEIAEKRRGYIIHQNRRKASWIDEDALHGPRVSPTKKSNKRRASWLGENGLTRTLSRKLSLCRHCPSQRTRSPTLPSTVTGQGRGFVNGALTGPLENRSAGDTDHVQRTRQLSGEIDMGPRLTAQQHEAQGTSPMNNLAVGHVRMVQPRPQLLPVPAGALSDSRSRRDAALNAAQQLAGRARVPSVDVTNNAQIIPRSQQNGADAELQAILRRTAERLQDGTRSARRQTMNLPMPLSSSGFPEQAWGGGSRECTCCNGHTDMVPSPAKSQRSAPAVMLYSELEGSSPRMDLQQGMPQTGALRPEYRHAHTRQISHVSQLSQVSQISMLSEPDSMLVTPSKRGSQPDVVHTALSSPSRATQTSPNRMPQVPNMRSYSPASDQSSALSTLYSEEESSPPTSVSRFESVSKKSGEMERRAIAQALRACDALDKEPRQGDTEIEREDNEGASDKPLPELSPRSLHIRKGTLGQVLPNTVPDVDIWASQGQDSTVQMRPRISPKAASTFTLQTPSIAAEDPFTAYSTPARPTTRLSQVFSPLPAELPGSNVSQPVKVIEPSSDTPTPSPSHRRVIPPPHRLQPSRSSPTLGHHQDSQLQTQPSSRVSSPVPSESGLSSVYDSYRYSRYSDSFEGSQVLARLSTTTMLTVPNPEASPTKSRWEEDTIPAAMADGRSSSGGSGTNISAFRAENLRLGTAGMGTAAYTFATGHSTLPMMTKKLAEMEPMVDDIITCSKRQRENSLSAVSDLSAPSAYSQNDEEVDKLAPLMAPTSTFSGVQATQITNTVAELRRMNSQVSCVSGYSTATANPGHEEIASPTLPALRGGGFSPGKKGAVGGAKNYLSLGSSPKAKRVRSRYGAEENGRHDQGAEKSGDANHETKETIVGIREDKSVKATNGPVRSASKGAALHRSSIGRPRRNTVVESFEQDLDRARRVLRESRGLNLQVAPETSKNLWRWCPDDRTRYP